ncbi:MAG: glutamine-hydrolyzing GMP synthase [Bacteroidales bacterium]|nr:glutamine-hydrolyzing GMP synthase [Bacteroidales bacterium]
MQEKILVLDFGSQYTQLIARRIRELNVYCEIYPFNHFPDPDEGVRGVILSGSPSSVRDEDAPSPDLLKIKGLLPLLGVCYGAQFLVHNFAGEVLPSRTREYGRANLVYINDQDPLLKNIKPGTQVWMSHGDTIVKMPQGFEITGSTADVKAGAYHITGEKTWGIQFHPEVYHTTDGRKILENFVIGICGCSGSWTPGSFAESTIASLKMQIGQDKVILGLSGGVDSTVAASLLDKAIGKNLTCIFVDNGLLRKDEFKKVMESYRGLGFNVVGVNAGQRFLDKLKGVSEPEKKRKAIGKVFIEVFEEEAHKVKDVKWLAQGTIYPDVIESVSVNGPSATIKSHHNVGGLPEKMHLKVVEPLRLLFKDEVRKVGQALGLPDIIVNRHPFPGPGLAIRILGGISREKLEILKDADEIFIEGLRKHGLYDSVWQAGAILLPVQSVGVMGDERTYENAIVLRAVGSTDGMTADWSHLPYDFLGMIANEIINKVKGINRVVYDISSKPPSTIEWE